MPSVYSTLKYEENAILWGSLFLTIIKNKDASTATSRLHNVPTNHVVGTSSVFCNDLMNLFCQPVWGLSHIM